MQFGTIRIQNLNLHYRMLGDGPDVLLIHGWASSGGMWQRTMEALAPRFRCWALDLAGFGDSDKPANGWYALPNYTATVREFAAAAGIERTHVVGHSMGGMIALDLAAAQPGLVRRLALVNPVVTGRVRLQLQALANRGIGRPLLALTRRVWPVATNFVVTRPFSGWLAGKHISPLGEDLAKATADSALCGLRAMIEYDTTPLLPRITNPTLVVVGLYDPAVSSREGRLAAARIPNARLEVMRTGHRPAEDRPHEFNSLLASFLTRPN